MPLHQSVQAVLRRTDKRAGHPAINLCDFDTQPCAPIGAQLMTPYSLPLLGPLAWIDVVLLGCFTLTAASLVYVALDIRHNPDFKVMKWGWLLVTLYMGPVA